MDRKESERVTKDYEVGVLRCDFFSSLKTLLLLLLLLLLLWICCVRDVIRTRLFYYRSEKKLTTTTGFSSVSLLPRIYYVMPTGLLQRARRLETNRELHGRREQVLRFSHLILRVRMGRILPLRAPVQMGNVERINHQTRTLFGIKIEREKRR